MHDHDLKFKTHLAATHPAWTQVPSSRLSQVANWFWDRCWMPMDTICWAKFRANPKIDGKSNSKRKTKWMIGWLDDWMIVEWFFMVLSSGLPGNWTAKSLDGALQHLGEFRAPGWSSVSRMEPHRHVSCLVILEHFSHQRPSQPHTVVPWGVGRKKPSVRYSESTKPQSTL